jgi:hypothetical protein
MSNQLLGRKRNSPNEKEYSDSIPPNINEKYSNIDKRQDKYDSSDYYQREDKYNNSRNTNDYNKKSQSGYSLKDMGFHQRQDSPRKYSFNTFNDNRRNLSNDRTDRYDNNRYGRDRSNRDERREFNNRDNNGYRPRSNNNNGNRYYNNQRDDRDYKPSRDPNDSKDRMEQRYTRNNPNYSKYASSLAGNRSDNYKERSRSRSRSPSHRRNSPRSAYYLEDSKSKHEEKKYNFLISIPKNYHRFIKKDSADIERDVNN